LAVRLAFTSGLSDPGLHPVAQYIPFESAFCGELQNAEFERAMLRERTKAGLDAAREEGRIGGRRPKLSPQQQAKIRKMVTRGDKTAADAARLFKIHRRPSAGCWPGK
jgi:hypothetical protein